MFKNIKISTKLITSLILIGLVPMIIMTVLSITNSSKAMEIESFKKLTAISSIKANQITNYFKQQRNLMIDVEDNLRFTKGIPEFTEVFKYGLDSPEYKAVLAKREKGLKTFMSVNGFADIILIDTKGNVVYTVAKESDLGENLITGSLKNSGLAKVYNKGKGKVSFADYQWYEPVDDVASFISVPIQNNGQLAGVAAFLMDLDKINEIMLERNGMGKTGESYLIGADKRMRSNSYLDPEVHSVKSSFVGTIEINGINTEAAREALAGKTDTKIVTDYKGNLALASYSPLDILGSRWAMITKIDKSETDAPVDALMNMLLVIMGVLVVVIVIISIFFARSITNGIKNIIAQIGKIIDNIIDGKLDARGNADDVGIDFKGIIINLNELIDAFVGPINVTAEYVDRIAKGDMPPKITDEYKGDFNEIKNNLNQAIDALNGFVDEMNHMSIEHDAGDIDVKINEGNFTGCYKDMAHGVNKMVFGHIAVKKKAMACIKEFGEGNFDAELETFPGKKVFINDTIEQLRENLKKVSKELSELIDASRDGRLDTRGDTAGFSGGWKDMISGVNELIDAFVGPINVTAEYVDRISKGDIPPKITDEYKGDFNEIKNNLNQAIDVMNGLLEETNTLIAATKDGKLDQRGDSSKFIGGWAELINGVNELIDAFVGPINVTAEYVDRIAKGDLPPKITDEYKGDFNEIKNNLNQAIDALNGFVDEMNHMSIEHDAGEIDVKINDDNFTGCYKDMAHGVNKMVFGHIAVKKKAMACIGEFGEGNFDAELETFPGKKVFINETIEKLRDNLKFVSSELSEIIDATREGRLDTRGDTTEFSGSWSANLIDGVNELLDVILEPVNEASDVLEVMAGGDLTPRMTGDYKGDNQKLKKSINTLGDSLSDLIRQVTMSAESVATSSNQITVLSGTLATSSEEQSSQSEEVASAVEEMARTISENAQNATTTSDVADQNRSVANQGGEVVKQTVSKMRDIAEFVSDSAVSIEKLGERSTEIGEIVSVIDEIADQTNLLALNAAIEAARAGEQGRGFAVVADEVRKLAERTTDATKQIATMIKGVQKETQDAVVIMKKGNEEVNEGISLADKAGMALEEVVTSSNEVKDMINNIAAASEEQSSTSELMAKNVEAISQVSNESARQITEVSIASEKMGELTHRLLALVDSFKINTQSGLNNGGSSAGHEDVAKLQYRNQDDYSLVAADRDNY